MVEEIQWKLNFLILLDEMELIFSKLFSFDKENNTQIVIKLRNSLQIITGLCLEINDNKNSNYKDEKSDYRESDIARQDLKQLMIISLCKELYPNTINSLEFDRVHDSLYDISIKNQKLYRKLLC